MAWPMRITSIVTIKFSVSNTRNKDFAAHVYCIKALSYLSWLLFIRKALMLTARHCSMWPRKSFRWGTTLSISLQLWNAHACACTIGNNIFGMYMFLRCVVGCAMDVEITSAHVLACQNTIWTMVQMDGMKLDSGHFLYLSLIIATWVLMNIKQRVKLKLLFIKCEQFSTLFFYFIDTYSYLRVI